MTNGDDDEVDGQRRLWRRQRRRHSGPRRRVAAKRKRSVVGSVDGGWYLRRRQLEMINMGFRDAENGALHRAAPSLKKNRRTAPRSTKYACVA